MCEFCKVGPFVQCTLPLLHLIRLVISTYDMCVCAFHLHLHESLSNLPGRKDVALCGTGDKFEVPDVVDAAGC